MLSSTSSFETRKSVGMRIASAFAITLVLAVMASEWLVRAHVLPQDSYASHVALLERSDAPDAAFGDSHTARGFAAGDGFVNLAFPSEGVSEMAWKTSLYFSNRAPGRVIVQADPHLFAAYRLVRSFEPYPEIADGDPKAGGLKIFEPRHRARLPSYWTTFVQSGFRLESKVHQTKDGSLLSSGDFSSLDPRAQKLEALKRAQTHAPGPQNLVAAAMDEYSEMLDNLSQKGADICLVTYPVTAQYRAAISGNHDASMQFFAQEAERLGATHVDARQAVSDLSLFRDADHLNAEGAQGFSSRLISSCFDEQK